MASKLSSGITEIVKGAGIVMVGSVAYNFLSFIYKFIAARYLTVEEFGMLTIGIIVVGISFTFAKLGIPSGAKRFISFYIGKNDYSRVRGIVLSSYGIVAAASLLVGLVIFVFSDLISVAVFDTPELSDVLRIFAVAVPFGAIMSLSYEMTLGFKKPFFKVLIKTVFDRCFSIVLLLAVIFFGGGLLYVSASFLGGYVLAAIASVVIVYFFLRQYKGKKVVYENKKLFYFSLPLIFTGVAGVIMTRIDKVIVGFFLGPEIVGVYAVAFAISNMLVIGLGSMNALYFPIVTRYFSQGMNELMGRVYESVTRLAFLVSFPVFLVFVLFSSQIITILYGFEYSKGDLAMIILSVSFMMVVFLGPVIVTTKAIDKTKSLFYYTFIAMIVNVILNFTLIPLLMPYGLGMEAAAFSTLVALFLKHYLLLREVKKSITVRIFHHYYIKYLISGFVATVVFFIIKGFMVEINLIMMMLLAFSFAMVYGVSLLLLKSFTEEDKMLLKAIEKKIGIKKSIVERVL